MYLQYSDEQTEYLKRRDPVLGAYIDSCGHICRPADNDLFTSIVRQVAGQQISGAALQSVWAKIESRVGAVTPERICSGGTETLRGCGLSEKKAKCISDIAASISQGELELKALEQMPDEEVIKVLTSFKGIGEWTAQMALIFGLHRPDVISFGDYGIRKGMQNLYGYDKIDRKTFETHAAVYSPYATTASLYLWQAAKPAADGQTGKAELGG